MYRTAITLIVLIITGILTACSSPSLSTAPSKTGDWLGYASVVDDVVGFVHDGTGWLLNKNQVEVEKQSEIRKSANSKEGYIADYSITVSNGDNSFSTVAKDVPCDRDGIPTESSIERIRMAVEDIKAKIKRLQS